MTWSIVQLQFELRSWKEDNTNWIKLCQNTLISKKIIGIICWNYFAQED
jgi:hypothetical protein